MPEKENLVSYSDEEGWKGGETYVITMSWKLLLPFLSSMMLKEDEIESQKAKEERTSLR